MLRRSHIIIGLCLALYFLPAVREKVIFFPVVLVSSLIPNIGSVLSIKNRGSPQVLKSDVLRKITHSYTMCILLATAIALTVPVLALPFFIGYASHLFLDSLTLNGIYPFWPHNSKISGFVLPGSKAEKTIDLVFVFLAVILIIKFFIP